MKKYITYIKISAIPFLSSFWDRTKSLYKFIFSLFKKKHIEFYLAVVALLIWFAFYIASYHTDIESYPVSYFQKIPFGVAGMTFIHGFTLLIVKYSHPYYYDLLNTDTDGGVNSISEWQRIKVGLFWVSFIGLGSAFLAAML